MSKLTLEQRFNKLDDMMKMYFKQETMIKAWDRNADEKNEAARQFNATKKWWQKKQLDNFPHYFATPIIMPLPFPVPPTYHAQYEETKQLIKDYIDS